jgi:hypothetical protein
MAVASLAGVTDAVTRPAIHFPAGIDSRVRSGIRIDIEIHFQLCHDPVGAGRGPAGEAG